MAESWTTVSELPVHPVGDRSPWTSVEVEGLVEVPLSLNEAGLQSFTKRDSTDDFRCEEGWVAPDQRWAGVAVADVLDRARVLPEARHVCFSAGDFSISMPLQDALESGALLAYELNGTTLTREHGGPCRLIAPGHTCYFSVKWVERVEVLAEVPDTNGREIALSRIGKL